MHYDSYWPGAYSFDIKLILTEIKKQVDFILDKIERAEKSLNE
jgi:hypothetical protein